MPLSIGDKLGPYEILALVGAGGMGEVYKARDTRLNRLVAIKFSKQQFTERFEREARAVAALNHPNICQLYDVGPNYLVMEFVEGEAPKGPMALDEVLRIAEQLANALEAANEKGIVHRDLKPGNIKITPEGRVKVLDFGLAKMPPAPAGELSPDSPTITMAATEAGMILGTAGYMSPEQARGKPASTRADIWAFGVVLYELTTGRPPFKGEDVTDTLAAIIRGQPDLSAVPHELRRLLEACLEKDPKKRLQSIVNWRLLLDKPVGAEAVRETAPLRSRLSVWGWTVAAVLASTLAALAFVHFREKPPVAELTRFTIDPPPQGQFSCCLAISPDGRKIAFTAAAAGNSYTGIWVRSLDTLELKSVYPDVRTATLAPHPFWSADSRFVAFNVDGKLRRVDATGGPAQTICDSTGFEGGTWSQDGIVLFNSADGLSKVSASGGDPSPVTKVDPTRHETSHVGPFFLPDGRHFLYLRRSTLDRNNGIYIGSLNAKPEHQDIRRLLNSGFPAMYAASQDGSGGYILFLRESTLMAQPFDIRRLALSGDAVPVAESVTNSFRTGTFSASATGSLIYRTGAPEAGANRRLTWLDRNGKTLGQMGDPADYTPPAANIFQGHVALSPDGTRVAVERGPELRRDIWLLDARGVSTRFTFDSASGYPAWSPDGKRIAFDSRHSGTDSLYEKASDGSGDAELLARDGLTPNWSSDGRFLLFTRPDPKTGYALWLLPMAPAASGQRQPSSRLRTEFREVLPSFSPNSRWVAYLSDESGRLQVYVRPFAAPDAAASTANTQSGGPKQQVSKDGAVATAWRADGKELFFQDPQRNIMAVDVSTGPEFHSAIPRRLFTLPPGASGWDVSPDGKRFLVNVAGEERPAANPPTIVMLNWTAALKK